MRINTPCWTQGRPRPRWEAMGFPRPPAQNPASNITQRTWTMDLRSLMSRPMPRQLCYLVCITNLNWNLHNSQPPRPSEIRQVQSNLVIRNVLIRNKLVWRNHFPWPIVNLLHKDKEHLALRNNFRVTKKFLITKFDCIFKSPEKIVFYKFIHLKRLSKGPLNCSRIPILILKSNSSFFALSCQIFLNTFNKFYTHPIYFCLWSNMLFC